MRHVICVNLRDTKPDQIKEGKEYMIDLDTLFGDEDGDWYVVVYEIDGTRIGRLKLSHFKDK